MRPLIFVVGIISAFVAPWWIVAICAVLMSLRWRAWEVIVLGALLDVLWFPSTLLWGIPIATAISVVFVWVLEPLRNELLVDQPAL